MSLTHIPLILPWDHRRTIPIMQMASCVFLLEGRLRSNLLPMKTSWWTNIPGQFWAVLYTVIQKVPVRMSSSCLSRWSANSCVLYRAFFSFPFSLLSLTMLSRITSQKKDLRPIPLLRIWENPKLRKSDSKDTTVSFHYMYFIICIILHENSNVSYTRTEFCLFYSLIYHKHLEQCLNHSI